MNCRGEKVPARRHNDHGGPRCQDSEGGRSVTPLLPRTHHVLVVMFGLPFVQPLAYLREYLTVLRHLLWDGQVDHAGAFLRVHATLPEGTTPPRTPLLISALRANAFRLAGEIADGAISWMCPISYLAQTARPALGSGAAAAGRPVPPLIAHVPVAMHAERDAV